MILDCHGRQLHRVIGFVGGYELVGKSEPPLPGVLTVVGSEVPVEKEEEGEVSAAFLAGLHSFTGSHRLTGRALGRRLR